ncbi:outer membrane porin, OprD family [Erwinia sp. S43]|uniref:OprD family outer membrane porin n=1 Tax=Erwinia sp. S43 TaxID=2769339 RepID=UPI00190C5602|nr:OprD family outer membrane porin [Erwinia sp. S43]MBK0032598.1 outer membrane porin, OprD family [Erwinia sp. S43]
MKKLITCVIMSGTLAPTWAFANFLNDSHVDLTARTMYYNNDSRNTSSSQPTGEQLGQGFIINGRSGYTDGPVGFGVDAIGLLGLKINGADGHNTATGMFPQHADNSAPGSFASARLALKAKVSKTNARAGFQKLNLPVIKTNDGRLLPSLYRGYTLTSSDFDNLTLDAGFIDRAQGRNQTHFQKLKSSGKASGYSSGFSYAGGRYTPVKQLALSYYYARLNDFYQQHYVGAMKTFTIAQDNKLKVDLRYFNSRNDGRRYGGNVDNDAFGGMLWWSNPVNTFGLGYQKLTGSSNFPYLDPGQSVDGISTNTTGGATGLISDSPLSKFRTAHEQAIVLRYSANLSSLGLTGLHFNSSYVSGSHAQATKKSGDQNEWVRTLGLSYDVPEDVVKGVTIAWKNVAYRTNITGTHSQDQNILLVSWNYGVL